MMLLPQLCAIELPDAMLLWLLALTLLIVLGAFAGRALLRRLREKRSRKRTVGTVTFLPKRVTCCGGALQFSVPYEFRIERREKGNVMLCGSGDVRLTVMQLPFRDDIRIRTLTGSELQRYFAAVIPMRSTPEMTYSFHGHSPAVTAWWKSEPIGTLACMHLIQVPEALFFMQFTGLRMEQQSAVEPILYSIEIEPKRIRSQR